MFRASDSDPAEDFTVADSTLVSSYYALGTTMNTYYGADMAYEIEYAPYGVDSNLCVGVGSNATDGTPVALETCGVSDKTLWVADNDGAAGTAGAYYPWINVSNTNFSRPYVLHYPGSAYPTDLPRPLWTGLPEYFPK